MFFKYAILFCGFLLIANTEAFVKRNVSANATADPVLNIDSLKKNMDEFKNCIDQSLSNVIGDVNENHLQPLFSVIGDHLNRFSRAFEDVATTSRKSSSRDQTN